MPEPPLPVLVLLPGMDGTGLMFEPFLKVLKGFEAQVLRYPAGLLAYADCVAYARARLPKGRPFLLLGESFSGPVAIALAAERPPGLVALVLCSSFARNPRPGLAWLAPVLHVLPAQWLPRSLLRRVMLGGGTQSPLAGLVDTVLPEFPQSTLKGRLLAAGAVDHTALLGGIQVPALALRASQDRLVPQAAAAWLRAHRPNLDLITLEGPHWLLQTRPEACLQAIQAFIERNQATRAVLEKAL